MSDLYDYEVRRRRDLRTHQLIDRQLIERLTPLPTIQQHSQSQPEEGGPPAHNGVSSGEEEEEDDEYSTLAEQIEYEEANVVRYRPF